MDKLETFKLFLIQEKGQSDSTIKTSIKTARLLLSLGNPLTTPIIGGYISSLISRRLSASYIKQTITIIRYLGECFGIPELQEYRLAKKIKLPKKTSYKSTFSDEEIENFRQLPYIQKQGSSKARYEMMNLVFDIWFFSGMRGKEIRTLETWQVDFGRNVFILPPNKVKTSEHRDVPISPVIKDDLQSYIKNIDGSYLFPPIRKRKDDKLYITDEACRDFFDKQIARLNIKRPYFTPYSVRHTFGKRQAEEDVSIFKIKQLMGHKRITTTEQYITMTDKPLQETIRNDRLAIGRKTGKDQILDVKSEVGKMMGKYTKLLLSIIPDSSGEKLTAIWEVEREH